MTNTSLATTLDVGFAGVKLILTPYTSALFNRAGMLASDGRCKTLDAAANGYVRGEACSALHMQLFSPGHVST